jgi:hypothetical protein
VGAKRKRGGKKTEMLLGERERTRNEKDKSWRRFLRSKSLERIKKLKRI